jgi:hypothetical protein
MHLRLWLVVALILATYGCTANKTRHEAANVNGPLSREQFRAMFPLDDALVDAVLADYNQTQAMLLTKSASGAYADVSLLAPNGRLHSGHDDSFSSGDKSIREVRDNYVAVQVGITSCVQTTGKIKCSQGDPLKLGMIDISKSHVSRVWSKDIPCFADASPCRFVKIQTSSEESDINSYSGYSAEPELVGHDYEVVFTLPEHVPVSYKQSDHFHISRTATAFFVYRFGEPIKPINLPDADATIEAD